jgi:hypothetical protein
MTNDWWADVGGQIVAGLIVLAAGAVITGFTPWGKRVGKSTIRGVQHALRMLSSVRVTTRPRIDSEIAAAVARAVESEVDDDEPRPMRPDEYDGWVMAPAPQARRWVLRNQTTEVTTVEAIRPVGAFWPFEWEPPSFPVTLAPGESVSFVARKLRPANSFMPFTDSPMANVLWEDAHGDEHEDIVWIIT